MDRIINNFEGISITSLKIIEGRDGKVLHALKSSDKSFYGFGEAYFSTVDYKCIKGWKKHTVMISNLIVPLGKVRFVFFDDRDDSDTKGQFFEILLSQENYYRLTVQPGLWMAFQGIGEATNLVLNVSSIQHDPSESISEPINTSKIKFNF